jgi:hypothetical protein
MHGIPTSHQPGNSRTIVPNTFSSEMLLVTTEIDQVELLTKT